LQTGTAKNFLSHVTLLAGDCAPGKDVRAGHKNETPSNKQVDAEALKASDSVLTETDGACYSYSVGRIFDWS
jgi:hypothetical protein